MNNRLHIKCALQTVAVLAAMAIPFGIAHADGTDKVLYNFETGTDGWWTFANGATLALAQDATTGADGSSGSLKAAIQWQPGGNSYLGLGVQPKWSMAGDSWPPYALGHFAVSFKSDVPQDLRVELRTSDKKTYSFAISGVSAGWKDYVIPFASFTSDGKGLDLTSVDIDQIVVIPGKVDDQAHTLWMDNVTISKAPAAQ